MYKATTKNSVISQPEVITPDGFASIFFKNLGADVAFVNDNIPVLPGSTFGFDNLPNVIIGEPMAVKFANVEADQRVLVIKTYFTPYKR
ncbi:MAG: hypothetical protein QM800_12685 [Paludibacter sp.]